MNPLKVDRPLRGRCQSSAASPRCVPSRSEIAIHLFAIITFLCGTTHAAEVIPPKPAGYFNDYAGVVSTNAAQRFNEQLAQFERETSNQIVVAVFPKMQTDSSIEDYTQRVAQTWAVGQKDRRNGAVLFVFVQDRKMFIQVGYGLEGALPDATAFDITEFAVKPHFKASDYEGGLAAGIDAMLQAVRGEYKGSGKTAGEAKNKKSLGIAFLVFFILFAVVLHLITRKKRRRGYRYSGFGGPFVGGWSSGSGGGWSSGGSSSSGFSGGGGSFGGGGAGSSW